MAHERTFGQWVKHYRKTQDLTQALLADRVGCSVSAIEKIEADKRHPSKAVAERLADAFALAPLERAAFLRAGRGADAPVPPPPSNLPVFLTSFIGREQESAAIRTLLRQPEVRLLTLTGTGGVGKTRLAVQVAADLLYEYQEGVYFVGLAAVRDPELVVSAIAQAVGVKESGVEPLHESLKQALHARQILLVLDSFEHVLDAIPWLADLLAAASALKLLVTSRTVLNLSDEHEFLVAPLPLPNIHRLPSIPVVAQFASVALFTTRSQAVAPHFALTKENTAAVVEICSRLDGLPLAIELAAARSRLFTPALLVARLSNRLSLLTGGSREQHPRQQTLQATIKWSYDLLDPDEQLLFARLAIFWGGCTIEAAEAVCRTVADRTIAVMNSLTSLVTHNLLQQQPGAQGEPRFVMLETIRDYALERLAASAEADSIQEQHARFFLAWVAQAESKWLGPEQDEWLGRVEADHDNIRAVLAAGFRRESPSLALELISLLWRFWSLRGYWSEGRQWIEQARSHFAQASLAVQAQILHGIGVLAFQQADFEQAQLFFNESIILRRQLNDDRGIGAALNNLGALALQQGKIDQAIGILEESLAVWRRLEDPWWMGQVLSNLGILQIDQGDYRRAQAFFEESLAVRRTTGNQVSIANSLNNLGVAMMVQEQYQAAGALFEESLLLQQTLQDKDGIARTLTNLGVIALEQGQYGRAQILFNESLKLRDALGDKEGIASAWEGLGAVAAFQNDPVRAARLWGAAATLRKLIGAPLAHVEERFHNRYMAIARDQLAEEAFTAALVAGQVMAIGDAMIYALEQPSHTDRKQ